jgi:hypothetical protein
MKWPFPMAEGNRCHPAIRAGWISMALGGRLYPNLGTFALLRKLENEIDKGRPEVNA